MELTGAFRGISLCGADKLHYCVRQRSELLARHVEYRATGGRIDDFSAHRGNDSGTPPQPPNLGQGWLACVGGGAIPGDAVGHGSDLEKSLPESIFRNGCLVV